MRWGPPRCFVLSVLNGGPHLIIKIDIINPILKLKFVLNLAWLLGCDINRFGATGRHQVWKGGGDYDNDGMVVSADGDGGGFGVDSAAARVPGSEATQKAADDDWHDGVGPKEQG